MLSLHNSSINKQYLSTPSHLVGSNMYENLLKACGLTQNESLVYLALLKTGKSKSGDIVKAENTLVAAYDTDVEPLVQDIRQDMGIDPDPICAYRQSGYETEKAKERESIETQSTLG